MGSPLFIHVCKLMQDINESRSAEDKKRMVGKFFYGWRQQCGDQFYGLMRLLLPQLDRTRYGIKEAKLAKAYIDSLGLGAQSEDAYNLSKWKLPSVSNKMKSSGDFASIASDVIERRSTVTTPTQTVQDVNDLLDTLNRSESDDKKKSDIFKYVVNHYTAFEQRWIIRIILKDLKMGMSENSIFDVYHPQARELYSVCSNLKKVCEDLRNPTTKLGKTTISLFRPFKPQLGFKGQIKDCVHVKHNGIFYIEEKIDGERMQMHYEQSTQKFQWYSRKATDYTDLYGASPTEEGKLAAEIVDSLQKAKSLILDGEMVAYDPKLDVFLPFGTLKSSAKDDSLELDKARPCFIVFDVVFCNGSPLVDYPLSDRLKVLESLVKPRRGYINILERKERTTEQDILNEMNKVVEQRQEGIMLKNPGARYEPGERNKTWIKIKPDYFDSLGENCDLLVVGGKYGAGRRGNKIAQFMCALRDDRKPASDPPHFVSFSMIGTGFSFDEIKEFGKFFQDIRKYNPRNLPSWLDHPERSTEAPDVLVNDYRNAVVIEVKASEVVFSQMWGAGATLRFPRFIRFRHDKSWNDCMTYSEIMQVRRSIEHKTQTYTQNDFSFNVTKKQRKSPSRPIKTPLRLASSQQGVETGHINQVSTLFGDLKFYVINGINSVITKSKLEYMIKENGGDFRQTDSNVDFVIAGKHNIRVDSLIHLKTCDVILPQWILDCIETQKLIPIAPKYMLFTTDKTEQEFMMRMDKYGDPYTEDATDQSLKEIWDIIPSTATVKDVDEIRQRYFSSDGIPGMFFFGVRVYFYPQPQDHNTNNDSKTITWVQQQHQCDIFKRMSFLIRFYGGTIVMDERDKTITHVIMQEDETMEIISKATKQLITDPINPPYFVTTKWIQQCVDNQTIIDEAQYDVKLPSRYQI
ncbi:ATP dependent DNA ligase domain-containing protein [Halteromyces radiatus]|uniref:ATP dependent DNA ligase domain-containing protein n=1 Tax=Halteromyces radiatus TaxID=101107 RepID=UPI002220E226|nr:ATP dependent DNA ligase domain-containing protein [Halteromyces radiatus]KAI8092888.1 ATP dependent DNA ligase domain-containing protein [Halteromyces radiatus]